jgi:class 3 adenylate cyclase/predicted ATPase
MPYVFGDYILDPEHYELRQAGTPVPLEPRVFDLLTYLVQHPGRTVTIEELLEQLYPNQFAPVERLTNCVAQARKALHDTGQAQQYIQTVRRRGYRFTAAVHEQQGKAADTGDATVLVDTPKHVERSASGGSHTIAERRHLTILVCRVVGTVEDAEAQDPDETLLDVLSDFQAMCETAVRQFEGHIARFAGDQLVVYFGYPQGHEDAARRAVHTALAMVAEMAALNVRCKRDVGRRLAVRVGIHTGVVVVRGDPSEPLTLGGTPTTAARLQDMAGPDTVVISEATRRLVERDFLCEPLGTHLLDGLSQPLAVYRIRQERPVPGPGEPITPRGQTPFVGREQQIGLLRECWAQVQDGRGQVILLSGEAGIGKSRLVQALHEGMTGETYTRIAWRCSPYYQHSAWYPVIAALHRRWQLRREDAPEVQVEKLERALEHTGLSRQAHAPLFAALLSLPLAHHYTPLTLTPQQQRQQTLDAVLAWLLTETERQPVCLVVEDLHWADPSTLECLDRLIEHIPGARLLLLLLFRPEFQPPWPLRPRLTQIALDRLGRRQVERMVAQMVGNIPLPPEVLRYIVTKTDGVPLFVEELTKMVLESGLVKEREGRYVLVDPLPALAIPLTLHDSLMARLDRLGAAKQVAQLGATIGREFSYAVLQATGLVEEATLHTALRQLVEAEILYQRGLLPQVRYVFKHALLQEAAYQSLLQRTRQQVHQQIAQVLETQEPDTRTLHPEILAQHYTAAGLPERALPYWQQAGQHATERLAYPEALAHLRHGLATLATLPDTRERRQQEFQLQAALGPICMALYGHAAPEVAQAYRRAQELSQELQDMPAIFPVLAGLAKFSIMRADFPAAHTLGHQCLSLAQRMQEAVPQVVAHWVVGATAVWQGHFATAREHLEQGLSQWDWPQYQGQQTRYPVVPGVQCLSYLAVLLWLQGSPDRALAQARAALTLAHDVAHPYSLAMAHFYAARLYQACGERQAVHTQAMTLIELAREYHYAFWETQGHILQGWAQAAEQPEAGLTQMRQGLQAYRATGAEIGREYFLLLLAEAEGQAGHPEAGKEWVGEAQAVVQATGAQYCTPELWRLQGELQRQAGAAASLVAPCFTQALTLARRQQAKAWELRAASSLGRLWQQQGQPAKAAALLASIYRQFTEGFVTADLQEAKALLEELEG